MPRTKPKPPYHHGNLRAELIECSLKLIQESGVKSLTLREIGTRLGVSRTAPYRHFADKAALLAAISEAGFVAFGDALEAAKNSSAPDFASQMDAMGEAYIRFANRHRAHFEVMFLEPVPDCPAADRSFEILESTVREGQARGEVLSGDSNAIARVIWAQIHGISVLRLDTDPAFPTFSSEMIRSGITRQDRGTSADRIQEIPKRPVDSPNAA